MVVYMAGHGGDALREEMWMKESGVPRLLAFTDDAFGKSMRVHRGELTRVDLPAERQRRKKES